MSSSCVAEQSLCLGFLTIRAVPFLVNEAERFEILSEVVAGPPVAMAAALSFAVLDDTVPVIVTSRRCLSLICWSLLIAQWFWMPQDLATAAMFTYGKSRCQLLLGTRRIWNSIQEGSTSVEVH